MSSDKIDIPAVINILAKYGLALIIVIALGKWLGSWVYYVVGIGFCAIMIKATQSDVKRYRSGDGSIDAASDRASRERKAEMLKELLESTANVGSEREMYGKIALSLTRYVGMYGDPNWHDIMRDWYNVYLQDGKGFNASYTDMIVISKQVLGMDETSKYYALRDWIAEGFSPGVE